MTSAPTAASTRREPELLGQTVVVFGGSAGIGLVSGMLDQPVGAGLEVGKPAVTVQLLLKGPHGTAAISDLAARSSWIVSSSGTPSETADRN